MPWTDASAVEIGVAAKFGLCKKGVAVWVRRECIREEGSLYILRVCALWRGFCGSRETLHWALPMVWETLEVFILALRGVNVVKGHFDLLEGRQYLNNPQSQTKFRA